MPLERVCSLLLLFQTAAAAVVTGQQEAIGEAAQHQNASLHDQFAQASSSILTVTRGNGI
jgi:hypothetical protein